MKNNNEELWVMFFYGAFFLALLLYWLGFFGTGTPDGAFPWAGDLN